MHPADPTQRTSGILLHPTSLPTAFGIGDIGPRALRWLDFLADTRTGLWQVLPLGPTGYGDSPYQSFSSFAGNPLLISPELLASEGFVGRGEIDTYPVLPHGRVDYAGVITAKTRLLASASERFHQAPPAELGAAYEQFTAANHGWLDDFALFMALKDVHGGVAWTEWDEPLRLREQSALARARNELAKNVNCHVFGQFVFFHQWEALRRHAQARGVTIVGDIPVYVAGDSSDVWTRQNLFQLDEAGRPTVVAGVPPDRFSESGQLWGNPIYAWEAHAAEGYGWWIDRLRRAAKMTDVVRIDHFRAFANYWEVPANAPTAETGRWVEGEGRAFFDAVQAGLGRLPFIAEDLGEMSEKVYLLREELGLAGMKILQFAFGTDDTDPFLPHNYPDLCVAYTGTHDNEPVNGWWHNTTAPERDFATAYFDWDGVDPAGRFTEAVWGSRANWAIAQLQDLLRLDSSGRMNTPSTIGDNWRWALLPGQLTAGHGDELRANNERHQRASQVS